MQLGISGELTYRELITAAQTHLAKPPEGETGEAYAAFNAAKVCFKDCISVHSLSHALLGPTETVL